LAAGREGGIDLTEELPPRAVAREVGQTEIGRHGLEPSGTAGTRFHLREPLKCPEKDGLGDILGLGRVAQHADGGAEHHVLELAHEELEPLDVGHSRPRLPATTGGQTRLGMKVSEAGLTFPKSRHRLPR
jgi:hypothetical protein